MSEVQNSGIGIPLNFNPETMAKFAVNSGNRNVDLSNAEMKISSAPLKINLKALQDPGDNLEGVITDPEEKGKFFCKNRYFIVTYAGHCPKNLFVKFFSDMGAKLVRVAHEQGNGRTIGREVLYYDHSHVFVDFGRHKTISKATAFDFEQNETLGYGKAHPNIGPIRFQKHLNRVYRYMAKEDHENDDLLRLISNEFHVDDVWACSTVQEAMRNCNKASEINAVIQAFAYKPANEPEMREFDHPWQQVWHDRVLGKGTHRKIDWIWDSQGGFGKTTWAIEMFKRYPKDVYMLTQFGGAEKAATIIHNALQSGWSGRVMIIDLPRKAELHSIYEPLESIRNGVVTATRYQGRTLCFDISWVIVLTNFAPDRSAMSQDRWRVWCHNGIERDIDAESYLNWMDDKKVTTLSSGEASPFLRGNEPMKINIPTAQEMYDDVMSWNPRIKMSRAEYEDLTSKIETMEILGQKNPEILNSEPFLEAMELWSVAEVEGEEEEEEEEEESDLSESEMEEAKKLYLAMQEAKKNKK